MPTTPGGRWSPNNGDGYDLITHLAAMQVSNESATAAAISAIPSPPPTYHIGTNSQRLALSGANLFAGLQFKTTDNGAYLWENRDGTASGWRISPGQVLAAFEFQGANTSGPAGTVVGGSAGTISTIPLPIGQRFKILGSVTAFRSAAGPTWLALIWRNAAADVTPGTVTGRQNRRASARVGSGEVDGGMAWTVLSTATVAAKVSAAIVLGDSLSAVYNDDNSQFWIESA